MNTPNSISPTRIAVVSILLTAILVALKLILGLISGSIAVVSDALDSASDLVAGLAALASVRIAPRPADIEHPYGHGKVEGISSAVSAGVVGLGGGVVMFQAVRRLVEGSPEINVGIGLAPVALAVVINLVLSRKMRQIARESGSLALASESAHLLTNVVQASVIIAGLTLVAVTGESIFDPLVALGLAGYMWWTAFSIVREALGEIMDVSLPAGEQRAIYECLMPHRREIRGMHHFRSRRSGPNRYVEMHLVLDPGESIAAVHRLTDSLETEITARLPRTVVTIHVEPDDGRFLGPLEDVLKAPGQD